MPGPPIERRIEALHPAFRLVTDRLVARVRKEGLPLVIFETRRSIARQNQLAADGHSNATALAGPHPWGLATDWVLDVKHPYWADVEERPHAPTAYQAQWDTGIESFGGRQVIVRANVLGVWRLFGQLVAESAGLAPRPPAAQVWGGAWYRKGTSEDTHHLGWDAGHTQHPTWQALAKTLTPPTR